MLSHVVGSSTSLDSLDRELLGLKTRGFFVGLCWRGVHQLVHGGVQIL